MIRVELPYHLRNLAKVNREVTVEVSGPVTQRTLLDALESQYPVLEGAIREHATHMRRPYLRFFACQRDISNDPPDTPVPEEVARGEKPFLILGAIAGG